MFQKTILALCVSSLLAASAAEDASKKAVTIYSFSDAGCNVATGKKIEEHVFAKADKLGACVTHTDSQGKASYFQIPKSPSKEEMTLKFFDDADCKTYSKQTLTISRADIPADDATKLSACAKDGANTYWAATGSASVLAVGALGLAAAAITQF